MKPRAFILIICFASVLAFLSGAEAQTEGGAKGMPSPAMLRSREDSSPMQVFISGTVVVENGASPAGASIELDCRGSVTREAIVGSNGNFSFRLEESNEFGEQFQDVSQYMPDPFGRDPGRVLLT